jgi:hypothetical protein
MGRFTLLMGFVAIAASNSAAMAQSPHCMQRDKYVRYLAKAHAEKPFALVLANNGGEHEILTSRSSMTWTILVTDAKGVSCVIAAGDHWQPLPDVVTREYSN